MKGPFHQALAVARKDIRSELRTRYALNAQGMFIIVVVAVVAFGIGAETLSPSVIAGLIWVCMFFSAVTGLGRSFISEEERGTTLLLRLVISPTPVYFGKLIVNSILALLSNTLIAFLFVVLLPGASIGAPWAFITVIGITSIGFAAALTIIAAIIARSSSKGALYPVLAFPVLLPIIILGVDMLRRTTLGKGLDVMAGDIALLAIYSGLLVVVSYILFDFLWKE